MLPQETSSDEKAVFYPPELDRNNSCSVDPISNKKYDDRYFKAKLEISE